MFPKSFQKLIDHFAALPSVGPKIAELLVLYLWKYDQEKLDDFSEITKNLKRNIHFCKQCFNISENGLCAICQDKKRDGSIICVVEDPLDVISLEKTRRMRGLYHVLGGTINAPVDKNNPLKIKELLTRLKKEKISEVIIATNPTTEGEATAIFVAEQLKPTGVRVTRIARGLPVGSDLDLADTETILRALEGRREL